MRSCSTPNGIRSSVPLNPKFAKVPAEQSCGLRVRDTSAAHRRCTYPDASSHQPANAVQPILSISNLSKTYATGFQALKGVNLDIQRGEIFALLGPNGAGKTTLIGIICGIVNATSGTVTVAGHDHVRDYRAARSLIGLVPQELHTDAFETVWATTTFSRGLFGKAA